jgi:polyisoprenoid-binding protein YceI
MKDAGDALAITGDLTIRGVTREVTLDAVFEGTGTDPWGGTRAGFAAETELSRKEWGLEWNVALETGGVLVGDKVKLHLDVEAVRR